MKTRAEAVMLILAQMGNIKAQKEIKYTSVEKGDCTHYGIQDLRQLLDFIYEEKPQSATEFLPS